MPPTAQLPQLPLSFALAPAPLGEREPPLQTVALRNGGPGALDYEIDAAPLAEVARGSYGFEVLRYAGGAPLRGERGDSSGQTSLYGTAWGPAGAAERARAAAGAEWLARLLAGPAAAVA